MTSNTPNTYYCDSCGFVYEPSEFAGVDIDAQDDDFTCPDCQASSDHFHLVVPRTDDIVSDASEPDVPSDPDLLAERLIYQRTKNPDVGTLLKQYQRKKLDPQPDFQRYEVWSDAKKSKLIESILLDMPIPPIYLAQETSKQSVVIDGQQRLMALFRFLNGDYKLTHVNKQIAGRSYSDLDEELQDRIEGFQLSVVEILAESDEEVRFELFRRLNEGSTSLNDQELRNCVHRGEYNDFLKRLAADSKWRKILRLKGADPHKRMVDVELVLRFMAFYDQSYMKHPDKKTGAFLDRQMVLGASKSKKQYSASKAAFRTAVDLSVTVLGRHAGRRFVPGSEEDVAGTWDSRLNRALLDVQLQGFLRHEKGLYVTNADAIREASIELMATDEFTDVITHSISQAKRVERRFDLWKRMIDAVIGDEDQGPRLFSREAKVALFEYDPTCKLCGNQILDIDDAALDHRKPYSKGGKTKKSNADLSHRYCNNRKGAKDPET